MSPRLILATRNDHKVRELHAILAPLLPGLNQDDVVGANAYDLPEPVEDEVTFAGNALLKARQIARATGVLAVADDSGLCVDALGGAPGVFSARWCGHHGDDQANLQLLLNQLSDVPEKYRGAHFHCAAVIVTPDGREYVREGDMFGTLLYAPRGENGFGYDPIFSPVEYPDLSSAELSPAQKDAISHRGKAFRALAPLIQAELSS
ncbi:MAG: RdgB/HAM1 family non-canonical purine NTP pyrophosphatase [Ancrocorticia sp.]|jgi:XTP/dITP diphosphohydrolase|nr:RdgB/HAM1 family non-canonical purine NTP pyrophosphatase [Ancrocorticia sp.]MCI1896560.1 RdgB/HAM1 family non-canonical purine NTP pyrophosphatase [Ancrocorticia sp.]MCI1964088.1 RdgB/HAM1 family non-canonical purine NTP pyrophosphatase [Ancrocorticia sp.]MCI2001772.1 RdgB/HAM1 family non-canonical purine NTP pyrophosphatase [Ancrocorticia sp.]MCI2013513.1 RdgB/HAM1 family non-canonical purine NTP pyrophosphatase [Ancrocorticia sp.]